MPYQESSCRSLQTQKQAGCLKHDTACGTFTVPNTHTIFQSPTHTSLFMLKHLKENTSTGALNESHYHRHCGSLQYVWAASRLFAFAMSLLYEQGGTTLLTHPIQHTLGEVNCKCTAFKNGTCLAVFFMWRSFPMEFLKLMRCQVKEVNSQAGQQDEQNALLQLGRFFPPLRALSV